MTVPTGDDAEGSNSNGESWSSQRVESGWDPIIMYGGGGGTFDPSWDAVLPECFVAALYVNDECVAQLDLQLREGIAE